MILLHVFVTDLVAVISSQSEGLGKMALGIVKQFIGSPSQPIGVVRGQLVRGQFVAVSCRGPQNIFLMLNNSLYTVLTDFSIYLSSFI